MIKGVFTAMVVTLFLVTAFLYNPNTVYACSCAVRPDPAKALEDSSGVFSGTVKEIRPTRYGKEVLFEVKETWKGVTQTQVLIATGGGGGDCGYEFVVGNDYLVYAHADTYYRNSEGLATNTCTRTTDLSSAKEDLDVFGKGKPPTVTISPDPETNFWYPVTVVLAVVLFGILFLLYRKKKQ